MPKSYQQRMQAKKQHIDKRIAEARTEQSVVILLTGNGKGKTSSALGMVLRALGWGQKIVWVSFLKGAMESGEKHFLQQHPQVIYIEMPSGFTWETQNKEQDIKHAQHTWELAEKYLQDESVNAVVFDEFTYMLNYHYLDNSTLEKIKHRTSNQNIIITGRGANMELQNLADTISTIENTQHAFDNNIKAVKGIDF